MLKFWASGAIEKSIKSFKNTDCPQFCLNFEPQESWKNQSNPSKIIIILRILLKFRASGALEKSIKSFENHDFPQFCLNFEPRESWKKQSNPSKNHNFSNYAYISSLWSPWKINQILWKSRFCKCWLNFEPLESWKINKIHRNSWFFEFCL